VSRLRVLIPSYRRVSTRRTVEAGTTWLCLLVQLVTSLWLGGLVLCVGSDGHIALESLLGGDCCPLEGPSFAPALASARVCDCTDTVLVPASVEPRLPPGHSISPVAMSHAILPAVSSPAPARVAPAANPSPPPRGALRALRSVVLVV
jgi:hypothetical protein